MAKKKTKKVKYHFTKTSVIIFLLLSVLLTICAFVFKKPIESFVNKENKNIIDYNGLVMHTIDVGQAEAIMIKLPDNKNMLIDSGNTGETKNEILKSYLNNNYFSQTTNKEIDYFVITHSDSDHCGGAVMIFNEYQVNKVFRPNIFSSKVESDVNIVTDYTKKYADTNIWKNVITSMYSEPNCEIVFSKKGIEILEESYSIKFYSPTENNYKNVNGYSPLIAIEYKSKKIMLTGDATIETEQKALENIPRCDVLKVAHHGSTTSTSVEFLEKVNPSYAIISCNKNDGNNYGHPHQEILNRLMEFMPSKNIYRTDLNGNIVLNIDEKANINVLLDVQGNTYYIKVEYLLIGSIMVVFVLCFGFSKNKKTTKK